MAQYNRMVRWIGFFIAIALGIGAGLFYGWVLNPVKYVDVEPNSLRIDYRSDVVLMVAEIYKQEGNLPQAVQRLSFLGVAQPYETVSQAISFAEKYGYSQADLNTLHSLANALKGWSPLLETMKP